MAQTRSAKKAHRVAQRRRVFNVRRARAMKGTLKDVSKLVDAKDAKGATAKLPALHKAIDKAAKHGTIKKNTAARMKSRIAKRISTITG